MKSVVQFLAVLAAVLPAVELPAAHSEPVKASKVYNITDLGSLGNLGTEPTSINDSGQIVGWSQSVDGVMHAFLWQRGKMSELPQIKGDTSSSASCINSKGQAVGVSACDGKVIHAVLWDKNGVVNLGTIGDDKQQQGDVKTINDRGQILVNFYVATDSPNSLFGLSKYSHQHALVCTSAGVGAGASIKGLLTGVAINNNGVVVGQTSGSNEGDLIGCVVKDGILTKLQDFRPFALNSNGIMVGVNWRGTAQRPGTAALWNVGHPELTRVQVPNQAGSIAVAVNDNDDVLVSAPGQPARLYICEKHHFADLNKSLATSDGWLLQHVDAINNKGQIVGYGTHRGKPAAFLLTPQ